MDREIKFGMLLLRVPKTIDSRSLMQWTKVVAIGTSDSNVSGDVSDEGIGGRDLWMVKIDENGRKNLGSKIWKNRNF